MTFSLSRRRLTLGAGALLVGSGIVLPAYFKAKPNSDKVHATVVNFSTALVDTLVPADDSAGALDIGLHLRLLERTAQEPKWAERLVLIETAIDKLALGTHRKPFSKLGLDQRESLLVELLQRHSPLQQTVRRFRHLILMWYYASTEGRASAGYQLPADYPAYPG